MKSGSLSSMVSVAACIVSLKGEKLKGELPMICSCLDRMNLHTSRNSDRAREDWQTNVDNWEKQENVKRKEINNRRVTSPQEMPGIYEEEVLRREVA